MNTKENIDMFSLYAKSLINEASPIPDANTQTTTPQQTTSQTAAPAETNITKLIEFIGGLDWNAIPKEAATYAADPRLAHTVSALQGQLQQLLTAINPQ